ncbi:thioredoxin family protein [Haloflavibacter putidus]|uniref:Thioredoxin family protein n=1 Tax=Haloflavibacter putidus TaxID=2576776 RepID=A0A508A3H4_9FLAO|nr:thioredoxin family protein [Haloflavibacter putidus]TQD40402.1 thioredoxin family protein [Haloflavibacter putidus]
MAKFGSLIQSEKPVLLCFYDSENPEQVEGLKDKLKKVAAAPNLDSRVIKIDAQSNEKLVQALKINHLPNFMIYKNEKLLWQEAGNLAVESLVEAVQKNA